jgi:predicted dinucleotide-binding enzyme
VLFVAGDHADAVATVASLIQEIGFAPVTLGPLPTARRQMEIGGPLSGLELFAADAQPSKS